MFITVDIAHNFVKTLVICSKVRSWRKVLWGETQTILFIIRFHGSIFSLNQDYLKIVCDCCMNSPVQPIQFCFFAQISVRKERKKNIYLNSTITFFFLARSQSLLNVCKCKLGQLTCVCFLSLKIEFTALFYVWRVPLLTWQRVFLMNNEKSICFLRRAIIRLQKIIWNGTREWLFLQKMLFEFKSHLIGKTKQEWMQFMFSLLLLKENAWKNFHSNI